MKTGTTKKEPSRLKKAFKRAAIGLTAGLTLAFGVAVTEYSGYRIFDGANGKNIILKIDPTSRQLTEGERALAQKVFGDAIDYDHVKIFNRSWFGTSFDISLRVPVIERNSKGNPVLKTKRIERSFSMLSPNGSIYASPQNYVDDFAKASAYRKASFIHEMTHVYQYQTDPVGSTVHALKYGRGDDYSELYKYKIDEVNCLADLKLEAQADLIAAYFLALEKYENLKSTYNQENLIKYMDVLAPVFEEVRLKQKELGLDKPADSSPKRIVPAPHPAPQA